MYNSIFGFALMYKIERQLQFPAGMNKFIMLRYVMNDYNLGWVEQIFEDGQNFPWKQVPSETVGKKETKRNRRKKETKKTKKKKKTRGRRKKKNNHETT